MNAAVASPLVVWIWAVVLGTSLICLVGFSRAGSVLFWKANAVPHSDEAVVPPAPSALAYVAVGGLLALMIALTAFAGPAYRHSTAIAAQLFDPAPYISVVLDTPGKLSGDGTVGDNGHAEADKQESEDH